MNQVYYPYLINEGGKNFEFESVGPKGNIKKKITYSPRQIDGFLFYNLGFGDLNSKTGDIDDLSISNNNDRAKILATVAASVLEFTRYYPEAIVYAEGSTPARTRLYQMGISENLQQISYILLVYGLLGTDWFYFKKNVNYQAFIAARK